MLCASMRSRLNKLKELENYDDRRSIIMQSPYHALGLHTYCFDKFCEVLKTDDNSIITTDDVAIDNILELAERIASKIDRLEEITTTNLVETFNSIRIKYDGGKNKNYIMKGLF